MKYVIVYDVPAETHSKIYALLKRKMFWVQNSVFENELSEAEFKSLWQNLSKLDIEGLKIRCYMSPTMQTYTLGYESDPTSPIL